MKGVQVEGLGSPGHEAAEAVAPVEDVPAGRSRAARLLLLLLAGLLVVDRVGAALTPYLAPRHPLLLVGLDATDKALLLSIHVAVVPLVLVSVARRLAGQLLYFMIGRHLGDHARSWMVRQGLGGPMARVERAFNRASVGVLFLVPREVVCILAGDAGVRLGVFAVVVVVRDVMAVLALRMLSAELADPISRALGILGRYSLPATLAGVVVVGASVLWHRRRRPLAEKA